jgi:hypothetical protein
MLVLFTLVVVYPFSLSVPILDWWIIPLKSLTFEEVLNRCTDIISFVPDREVLLKNPNKVPFKIDDMLETSSRDFFLIFTTALFNDSFSC